MRTPGRRLIAISMLHAVACMMRVHPYNVSATLGAGRRLYDIDGCEIRHVDEVEADVAMVADPHTHAGQTTSISADSPCQELDMSCVSWIQRYRHVKIVGDSRWRAIYLLLLKTIAEQGIPPGAELDHDMAEVPRAQLSDPFGGLVSSGFARAHHNHTMVSSRFARAHHNHTKFTGAHDRTVRSKQCRETNMMPLEEEFGCEERAYSWRHDRGQSTIHFYYTGGMTFRTVYLNQLLREIWHEDGSDTMVILASHRMWYQLFAERGFAVTPRHYAYDLKLVGRTLANRGHMITSEISTTRVFNESKPWEAAEAALGSQLGEQWVDLTDIIAIESEMLGGNYHHKGRAVKEMALRISRRIQNQFNQKLLVSDRIV